MGPSRTLITAVILISEGLVRISVGLEHVDDIIKDLKQALG